MLWLVVSIFALTMGVVLSSWVREFERWPSLLHGFVVGFVGFLLLLEVMPAIIQYVGNIAWMWFSFGLIVVSVMEQVIPDHQSKVAMIFMTLALSMHSLLDGTALGSNAETFLVFAVLAHRLPMGFTIGAYFVDRYAQWLVLCMMVFASVIGFYGIQYLPLSELSLLQALASGGVAHILLHSHNHENECVEECEEIAHLKYWRIGGLGLGILSFSLVSLIGHSEHHHEHHSDWDLGWSILLALILSFYMFWDRFHPHSHPHRIQYGRPVD